MSNNLDEEKRKKLDEIEKYANSPDFFKGCTNHNEDNHHHHENGDSHNNKNCEEDHENQDHN